MVTMRDAGGDEVSQSGPLPDMLRFNESNFGLPYGRVYNPDASPRKQFSWYLAGESVVPRRIRWVAGNETMGDVGVGAAYPADSAIAKPTNTTAELVLTSSSVTAHYWSDMAIRIYWSTDTFSGFTQSGVFTVARNADQDQREAFNTRAAGDLGHEQIFRNSTSPPSSTPAAPSPSSSSSAASSRGSRGLSTGAKAGIGAAVGLVGLLLIAGLATLLLRRRKRAQEEPGMAPTPYSDGGANRQSREPIVQEAALSSPHQSGRLDVVETSMPGGVTRHLVEEGMTREEILLLEEEERQLDAEIERAARRNT